MDPDRYPYDDGEVIMKKVMSPEQWGSTSDDEGEYLISRDSLIKTGLTLQDNDPKENPTTSTPFSTLGRFEIN